LTIGELKVLSALVNNPGIDMSYHQLHGALHDKEFVVGYGEDGYRVNIRGYIKRIRKKFCDIDPEFDEIKTYTGFGYHWAGEPSSEQN